MKIAVASGKGGTGKTLVATNLAVVAAERLQQVTLVDCDVEEPNDALFLNPEHLSAEDVMVTVPVIDNELCTGCRRCAELCQFNALITVKNRTYVFEDMCHACGLCMRVCPENAITGREKKVGTISLSQRNTLRFLEGRLDVGRELPSPIIRKARAQAGDSGIVLLDAPPGTTCPVVTTLRDCDAVILVTEPTPFGLHDLKLAAEMASEMGLPVGIVENRAMDGVTLIQEWSEETGVPIWMQLPLDRAIAECYAHGNLVVKEMPAYRTRFCGLLDAVMQAVSA